MVNEKWSLRTIAFQNLMHIYIYIVQLYYLVRGMGCVQHACKSSIPWVLDGRMWHINVALLEGELHLHPWRVLRMYSPSLQHPWKESLWRKRHFASEQQVKEHREDKLSKWRAAYDQESGIGTVVVVVLVALWNWEHRASAFSFPFWLGNDGNIWQL